MCEFTRGFISQSYLPFFFLENQLQPLMKNSRETPHLCIDIEDLFFQRLNFPKLEI